MSHSGLRAVYFGTFREEYARNQLLIEGLRRAGVEVIVCHRRLWLDSNDRLRLASGAWRNPAFWLRVARAYLGLLADYLRLPDFDVVVVGFPGNFDVFLAWLLTRLRRKPLVWDVLNSVYLMSTERGLQSRSAFTISLLRWLESLALRLPEILLLDTSQFIDWFTRQYKISPDRFRVVIIGADDRYFKPILEIPETEPLTVIYYGGYIPNHGVEVIIEAANLLKDEDNLRFEMIGEGPTRPEAERLVHEHRLENITFIPWLEREDLVKHIAASSVVLGAFSHSQQLSLTNNNKIYEAFAMRKAVVTARTPALPAQLKHGESLLLVERGSPQQLAQAILELKNNPGLRRRLGENGRKLFEEHFNPTVIGESFAGHLRELLKMA